MVNRVRMILTTDDFRSHVARSAAGILAVFFLEYPGHSQIRDSHIPFFVEDDILWLDVPMNYFFVVQVFQA